MSAEDRSGMSIGLTCNDMEESVRFYRDRLGFEMKESWPTDDAPQWANMVLGEQSVMLGGAMQPEDVGKFCGGNADKEKHWRAEAEKFRDNAAGAGIQIYLMVDDSDGYCATIRDRDVQASDPETQFYGIREVRVYDPDGYQLVFYTPVTMSSCGSCGKPLQDAKPGEMYCDYCTDDSGKLRPYDDVFEGTVTGYFMRVQNMGREEAEQAAREHLGKMPAWASQGERDD